MQGFSLLLVLLVALLHTGPVRRYALAQAIPMLARQGVDIDAGALDYNLLTSTASLHHVTVRSRQTPDLPPLLRVEQLRVDLNLWKLLQGKFYLEDAQVRKPVVHLVVDKDGRDNIPNLPASSSSKSEIDFLIRKLRLSGGSLRVEERRLQIDTSLPLWQLAIDGDSRTRNHLVRLEAQQPGRIAFQQRTLAIPSLTVEAVLQRNALDIHGVRLGLGDSIVAFSGKLDNFQDPRYDFKAETDLDLGSITRIAGVPQKIDGTVHASLTATGPLAQMHATARLDGRNLTVERLNRLGLKAEIAYDASSARVQIASFILASPEGTIQGKGSVALNTVAGESTLNAAVRGLDLAQVSRIFQLPMRIASSASGEVDAHWPALAFDQAAGDASLRLVAAQAEPSRNVVPVSGAIQAKATGNRIVVGISALTALNARATGQVTLTDRRALSGAMKLDAPDVSGSIADAEKLTGQSLGTPVGGALSADAALSGTLDKPAAAVTLSSNNLQAGTLSGIALTRRPELLPGAAANPGVHSRMAATTVDGVGHCRAPGRRTARCSGSPRIGRLDCGSACRGRQAGSSCYRNREPRWNRRRYHSASAGAREYRRRRSGRLSRDPRPPDGSSRDQRFAPDGYPIRNWATVPCRARAPTIWNPRIMQLT